MAHSKIKLDALIAKTARRKAAQNKRKVKKLGKEFCLILKEWLKEKFDIMVNEHMTGNYVASDICVTHNYCDPNQAMINAFEKVYKREINIQSDKDNGIINNAWQHAKQSNFNL